MHQGQGEGWGQVAEFKPEEVDQSTSEVDEEGRQPFRVFASVKCLYTRSIFFQENYFYLTEKKFIKTKYLLKRRIIDWLVSN